MLLRSLPSPPLLSLSLGLSPPLSRSLTLRPSLRGSALPLNKALRLARSRARGFARGRVRTRACAWPNLIYKREFRLILLRFDPLSSRFLYIRPEEIAQYCATADSFLVSVITGKESVNRNPTGPAQRGPTDSVSSHEGWKVGGGAKGGSDGGAKAESGPNRTRRHGFNSCHPPSAMRAFFPPLWSEGEMNLRVVGNSAVETGPVSRDCPAVAYSS